MVTLKGDKIYLRALEPEDLDFIYILENNEEIWEVSNTQTPYSRYLIRQYLENAHQDIYEAKQLRLAICHCDNDNVLGLIDLFDFDPLNNRAGVGIIIDNKNNRNSGIGSEALRLLIGYSFTKLRLHQLYANIDPGNAASVTLFTNFGFECTGNRKEWNKRNNSYADEAFYQLINKL